MFFCSLAITKIQLFIEKLLFLPYYFGVGNFSDQFSRFVDGRYSDNLEKNDYVEIISGRFAGVRGYYARPFKDKCVVCVVEGLAVCTTYIPAYALKIIEKGK